MLIAAVCVGALPWKRKTERSLHNSGQTGAILFKGNLALIMKHSQQSLEEQFLCGQCPWNRKNDQHCLNIWFLKTQYCARRAFSETPSGSYAIHHKPILILRTFPSHFSNFIATFYRNTLFAVFIHPEIITLTALILPRKLLLNNCMWSGTWNSIWVERKAVVTRSQHFMKITLVVPILLPLA